MDATNNILVSYDKRNILFKLPSSLIELKKAAYAKFSLDSSTPLIIQAYNESWCEYIDVTEDNEIVPGCKYRIILQLPQLLYAEESLGHTTQNDSHNTDLLSSDFQSEISYSSQETSSCLRELSEPSHSSVQTGLCLSALLDPSSSVEPVVASSINFSFCLNEALNKKMPLSRVLRSELVNDACRSITVNTKYPSSIMVTDAARKIVLDYPYLKESIGTGYGGWRQAIRDRLKNLRRFDRSDEVKRKRKITKTSVEIATEKRNDKNSKKKDGTPLVTQQIDPSCELNESFDIRRNEIVVGKSKVDILKTKYPRLFSKLELEKEFYRVTGKSNIFRYIPKFLEFYGEYLNNLLTARKKLPVWAQTIKCMLDGSNRNVQTIKEIFILITLPVHFSEEQLAFTYPVTVNTNEFKEAGSSSPHLGIVGLETNHPTFFVLTEHEIVLELHTLSEAITILMASYYIFHCEYPKQWKKTLLFTENFIFDIDAKKSKVPPKVVNFVQKLKDLKV